MAKELRLRGGTTVQHSTFTGVEREVTVDTTKDTLVVHDGVTPGGKPLATEAYADTKVAALINDTTPAEVTVYSGTKTQALHDAQAVAISNLASCSGAINNTTSPVFSPIPLVATDLPFTVVTPSTDSGVFSFDDINNTITFLKNGNYNFFSTIAVSSTSGTSRTVTFRLVNNTGGATLVSQAAVVDIPNNTSENFPLNTLLTVGTGGIPAAPLTIKVQVIMDAGTDKALQTFSSILARASVANEISIDTVPTDGSANAVASNGVFDALALKVDDSEMASYLLKAGGTMTGAITAIAETKVAMGANDINLVSGNLFTKTISGAITLTVSGWLASGNANSFILELTNGGSAVVTYFAGVKWAGGTAPTLTAAGVDILGFYSHDGGTTVRGIVLAKDSK